MNNRIVIANIRNKGSYVKGEVINIMRPSPLGNPYKIDDNNTREDVLEYYDEWLTHQLKDVNSPQYKELMTLIDILLTSECTLILECCCYPLRCHGNIIKGKVISFFLNKEIYE